MSGGTIIRLAPLPLTPRAEAWYETDREGAMPLYDYECTRCAHRFEMIMKIDADAPACPRCGSQETKRRIAAFRTNAWSRFLDGMEKRISPEKFK
ncbi:MAG: FmdB family zinc ribbon protein [Syntrophales bacterium]